jgi:hypothetical protein
MHLHCIYWFAASLVTSPALGAYLENAYSNNLVVWLATAVAVLDVLFILLFVPESLPEKIRPASYGSQISWEQADPFGVSINISKQYIQCKCINLVDLSNQELS